MIVLPFGYMFTVPPALFIRFGLLEKQQKNMRTYDLRGPIPPHKKDIEFWPSATIFFYYFILSLFPVEQLIILFMRKYQKKEYRREKSAITE